MTTAVSVPGAENPPDAVRPAAQPTVFPMPGRRALAFVAAALVIGLTQGLAQGFVSANLPQIAGDLGISPARASWLIVAFLVPRVALPLLLIKLRDQFGLRRFAEVAVLAYLLVSLAALAVDDLRSALAVQFALGMASAPLSTLAFMYMLEPLPPQWKMRLGLPLVLAVFLIGPLLARVISPAVMADAGWSALHLLALGLAALCLAVVWLLPLTSPPRVHVLAPLDLVSWLLVSVGLGGLTTACVMGPIHGWTDAPWLGWTVVAALASLALAVAVELNRKAPLLDIRWLVSPEILHLTATLLLFRLVLSEQSAGAPRMFQMLGVGAEQMVGLFAVICAATLCGALLLVALMRPQRVAGFHLLALALVVLGAWMDSHVTPATRPAQMMTSQAMIGAAGILFLAPAMMRGLLAALARGPAYLLSFVIVFISTQSLGGAMGSGLFSSFIDRRQAFHLQRLVEGMAPTDPQLVAAIARQSAQLAAQIADPALARAQAAAQLLQQAGIQAQVLAYADAYRLTAAVALAALVALILHLFRDWLVARRAPALAPAKAMT